VVLTWLYLSPRDELTTHPEDDMSQPLTACSALVRERVRPAGGPTPIGTMVFRVDCAAVVLRPKRSTIRRTANIVLGRFRALASRSRLSPLDCSGDLRTVPPPER